jgi:hypothetical protein
MRPATRMEIRKYCELLKAPKRVQARYLDKPLPAWSCDGSCHGFFIK